MLTGGQNRDGEFAAMWPNWVLWAQYQDALMPRLTSRPIPNDTLTSLGVNWGLAHSPPYSGYTYWTKTAPRNCKAHLFSRNIDEAL